MRRLLLASEGRPFAPSVLADAVVRARAANASVVVLSTARIWGTSFGFPNPWLLPSRREMDAQRTIVADAVAALEAAGLAATGRVVATRNAASRIAAEARASGCEAIVMGADKPSGPRFLSGLWWSEEPRRVERRARVPVHLVEVA